MGKRDRIKEQQKKADGVGRWRTDVEFIRLVGESLKFEQRHLMFRNGFGILFFIFDFCFTFSLFFMR